MNKAGSWLVMVGLLVSGAKAQRIVFEGIDETTVTTGNLLKDVRDVGITTNVQEIGGLIISARSGGSEQKLNTTNGDEGSFGVNTDNMADETDAFEAGEKLIISFNRSIQLNRIDFNRLQSGETFTIAGVGLDNVEIAYADLANKTYGYFDTNLTISAGSEVELYTTGDSVVGLDGIDVTVLGSRKELDLSIVHSSGTTHLVATVNETSSSNYALQCCDNLASNVWTTISGSFATSTNWMFESSNSCGFYRVIAE